DEADALPDDEEEKDRDGADDHRLVPTKGARARGAAPGREGRGLGGRGRRREVRAIQYDAGVDVAGRLLRHQATRARDSVRSTSSRIDSQMVRSYSMNRASRLRRRSRGRGRSILTSSFTRPGQAVNTMTR